MKRPTYNHTRGDGPFAPCAECFNLMSRDELLAYASDLEMQVKDLLSASEESPARSASISPTEKGPAGR